MSEYTHNAVRKENARILLSITVPSKIVTEVYRSTLQEISKTAQIKGFRKGKVPVSVLESKYTMALQAEATQKIIQEAVPIVLENVEQKPLPYSSPQLEADELGQSSDLIIKPDSAFSFTISYDTEPEITLADLSACPLTQFSIKISKEDIEAELKEIQARNTTSREKDTPIKELDLVTFSYVELDDKQEEIKETARQDYTITVGKDEDIYDLGTDLIGMKNGEEKIFTKTYPKNFHNADIASKTLVVKALITRVREQDIPAIDNELAQDVSDKYKTLTDLKAHLTLQLEDRAKNLLEDIYQQEITDYLVAHSTIEIPQSAIDLQLDAMWKNFLQQYGGDEQEIIKMLQQNGNSKSTLFQMWQNDAKTQITKQLIINKLIDTEKIEISDEDVENRVKADCEKSEQPYESVLEYYKKNNLMPQIKFDLQQKTLFEILKNRTIIEIGKDFSFTELLAYKKQKEVIEKTEQVDE